MLFGPPHACPRAGLRKAAQPLITTILAVLAAGVHVPIVGSSDSAAKKEDRKEDGAPPKAEEQA